MTKAILGHPYSGALYGYFSDEIGGRDSHTGSVGKHSYYSTLYGRNYAAYVDVALTFLLLYDDVWMAPADNYMPRSRLQPESRAFVPELGLHTDWDDYHPFRQAIEENGYLQQYLQDPVIKSLLGKTLRLPAHCWEMIIETAVYDAALAVRERCPLLCSPGRRTLISRLIEIDRPSLHPRMSALHEVRFIESYAELTGMALKPKNIDDLMDAKPDKDVRNYGRMFLSLAYEESRTPSGSSTDRVARLVRDAIEKQQLASRFSGALNWIARFARIANLPIVPLLAQGGAKVADYVAERAGWYEFSGSIDRAVSRATLIRTLDDVMVRPAER